MPQLSLYLDNETLELVKRNAQLEQLSLSKYVASVVREKADTGWPEWFWDLYGSIDDETFTEPEDIPFNQMSAREFKRIKGLQIETWTELEL